MRGTERGERGREREEGEGGKEEYTVSVCKGVTLKGLSKECTSVR